MIKWTLFIKLVVVGSITTGQQWSIQSDWNEWVDTHFQFKNDEECRQAGIDLETHRIATEFKCVGR